MTQNIPLNKNDVAIEPFFDTVQEMLSGAAPYFQITILNSTTLRLVGGTGHSQQSVAIDGLYRFRSTNIDAPHPATAAGVYDVYVTTGNNDFTGLSPNFDLTVYPFGFEIRASGSTPTTAHYRKVAETDWSGSAITGLRQLVGTRRDDAILNPTAPLAGIVPLRARGAAGQTAALATFEASTGTAKASVAADGTINSVTGYQVNGAALAASHLLNGTFPGALSAPTLALTGSGKTMLTLADTGAQSSGFTIGGDTNLYRAGGLLQTDSTFSVNRAGTNLAMVVIHPTEANGTWGMTADGTMTWGPGGAIARDVNLYRLSSGTLRTDGAFTSSFDLFARHASSSLVRVGAIGPGGEAGVALGSTADITAWRDSSAHLKLESTLAADAGLQVRNKSATGYSGFQLNDHNDLGVGFVGLSNAAPQYIRINSATPIRLMYNGTARIETDSTGIGFYAKAPVAQQARPTTLDGVITVLANLGLTA